MKVQAFKSLSPFASVGKSDGDGDTMGNRQSEILQGILNVMYLKFGFFFFKQLL